MIPKIIHCIWLSGDDKPVLYLNCLKSWQEKMPDYEIKEWSLDKFPNEVTEHPFVKGALESRKWAYATDYIRLWFFTISVEYIWIWTLWCSNPSTRF